MHFAACAIVSRILPAQRLVVAMNYPWPDFNPRLSGSRNRHVSDREPADVLHEPNKTRNDGSVLPAVGDEGVPIRQVAEILASRLNIPAVSVTAGQAGEYVGFLGGFWGFDGPPQPGSPATYWGGSRPTRD
jgi:hypothetical protein